MLKITSESQTGRLEPSPQEGASMAIILQCCLKIIFLVVNASNLIIRIPFERKLKNAINKIYLLANVSYFLKNDIVKLQNTEN